MLPFDERTIGRGIDYYLNGHVVSVSYDGTHVTAAVSGTRAKPYTVMVDTTRFERSACTCPVGYACKHLVAVVLEIANDEHSEPIPRARAVRFAKALGLLRNVVNALEDRSSITIDLEAEIREARRRSAAEMPARTRGTPSASPRYLESTEGVEWRLALLVDVDAERPQIALVRQQRGQDGSFGRVEAYRDDEPVLALSTRKRRLVERLRVLGCVAPVSAFAREIAATKLPVFAGSASCLSESQQNPVKVIKPSRFDLDIVPVATVHHSRESRGGTRRSSIAVSLHVGLKITAGRVHYAISPRSPCAIDEGLGVIVASYVGEAGLLLIADANSPLSAVYEWLGSGTEVTPAAVANLRSLAKRFPESISIRSPRRIRVAELTGTPVFTLTPCPMGFSMRLELQEEEAVDGYSGDEYVAHVRRLAPPDHAIAAGSRLIGSSPREDSRPTDHHRDVPGPWLWDQSVRRGTPKLLAVARELDELRYTVYVSTVDGKRLVRRSQTFSVSMSSGINWFAPVVSESDRATLDAGLLREIALRGALDDGRTIVLFSADEIERIRRLLALEDGLPDGRFRTADLASFAELVELVDEVPPDLEPVRRLATAIVSGRKPRAPRKPTGLTARLRPYQRAGFAWLASLAHNGLSGCLADDMGLGKTVQALAFMLHLVERNRNGPRESASEPGDRPRGSFLVIAPVSTLGNWRMEAGRFAPGLTALIHHGSNRSTSPRRLATAHLIVTSYATAMRDAELLAGVHWRLIVLDEAQAIKNPHARTTRRVKQLSADLRLCLTGTPVENVSTDLWSIMDFLVPGLLGSLPAFARRFPKRNVSGSKEGAERLARLRRIVSPFLLRRTKEAVAPELPPKIETVFSCAMGSKQAAFYETLRVHHHALVQQAIAHGEITEIGAAIFTGLLRLRQAAIYPPSADETGGTVPSVKGAELLSRLDEISQEGHRALVFSQFVSALSTFRDLAAERGIATLYLDGQTRNRDKLIARFQHSQQSCVFFISLKAGGTGINLTAADYVFICDPWWNPQVERQAVDRAHRIGRERPVIVTRLVTAGTVEEKVLDLQEQKRTLAADLISENAGGIDLTTGAELLALFER